MSQHKFEKLVELYQSVDFQDNSRQGILVLDTQEKLDLATNLLSEGNDEYGLQILDGNVDTLQVGESIELVVNDPKLAIGIVATNFDDLLSAPKARIKEPIRYFVIDNKFCVSDQEVPDSIERYRNILKLISLLKQTAAYLDESAEELIFIQDGKYEVPIQFNANDLLKIDMASINRLLNSFEDDIHRDQKLAILAKSIQSVCSSAKPKERFQLLLEHLTDLLKSFSEGYRLFVADFSYDKIVNQLEVAKLEEVGKIHKTFSDIQNQILGIPVATIVVATQMKVALIIGYEFWVNTAVLVGCWVFAILGVFVLRNQLHTLKAIGDEIDRKKKQMLKDYKPVEDLITKSFPFLEKRLSTQRWAFYTVDAIFVFGLIISHVVYFNLTDPAYAWVLNVISNMQS
ncbi:MAG: hypothetical protein PHO76_07820 [Methylotenera sp.]|nr:hypothetical protein [Methylotenera sp.]MDD4924910.1 hypothetical protein [Methylotenera sp.]